MTHNGLVMVELVPPAEMALIICTKVSSVDRSTVSTRNLTRLLSIIQLEPIVRGEIYSPRRQISKNCRSKATI